MMKPRLIKGWFLGFLITATALFSVAAQAETYQLDATYTPMLPAGMKLGAVSGIAIDSQGCLIVGHRGPRPILVYDPAGKLVHMFGDDELTAVHGVRVDGDDNIWVTDYKNHTVMKYSSAGKVLLVLGKRDVPGADEFTFNRATDVAFAPNGDVFVSDGYGNNRIVKFTREGKYVKAWGVKGKAEGQLHLPHSVQFDARGLLHVGDRENNRVQVFDQEGTFVRSYGGFAPYGMSIAADQSLFVADGRANQCLHLTLTGKVLAEWGGKGSGPGQFNLPHCLAVDRQGNVYVGEIDGQRLQRFVRQPVSSAEVLAGLQKFYEATARPDGSFQPSIDPAYRGMSDSAYSDLAAVTYAVTISKTFGWKLPREKETGEFLLSRQKSNGDFFNVAGTVDPNSPEGRTYNTTQGLVALHALGMKPRHDPLPVFEAILKEDYKQLPAYSTSFFPLAYLCAGRPIPEKADQGIRALMVQDETGYTNDHVAATFHASHYYRLVGEETPRAKEMVARILRDQQPDGSWLRNMPARDRHATFDAVFTLVHEGQDSAACRAAIKRAADWALSCRNDDGGFGHYPGSTSDADANYFQVGTLVMAGVLKPTEPLPAHPELFSWGHLMPIVKRREHACDLAVHVPGWVAAVAFNSAGDRLAVASADHMARLFDVKSGRELQAFRGHDNIVAAVHFHPAGELLATGSYDHSAAIWDVATGALRHRLTGHQGAVMSVAFSPDKKQLATGSLDGTIMLWDVLSGKLAATLTGHKSWVNSLAYHPESEWLASGSSDGTIQIWSLKTHKPIHALVATNAEVRSVAISPDGSYLAAGLRYGHVKVWNTSDWQETMSQPGKGDLCAVAFSPNGKQLVATEGDWNRGGQIKVFNLADGKIAARYQHTGEVLSVAVSPDGSSLAAGGADKSVRIWKLDAAAISVAK